uniref:cytochrome c-type biogenesis CcmF C-terminal domain-containing protein n=1 Tax=Methanococcoides sp. TaxID=1966350 RepID=UPI00272E1932
NIMLASVLTMLLLAALITLGMLTPLVVKLTTGNEISMGAEYFNDRSAIPTAALVVLLTTGLLYGYFGAKKALLVTGLTVLLSLVFAFISPFGNLPLDVTVPLTGMAVVATFYKMYMAMERGSWILKLKGISAHVIHLGILFILIGIVASSNMQVEGSDIVTMDYPGHFEGQNYIVSVTDMHSVFEGSPYKQYPGSSYATHVTFDVYKKGAYFDSGQVKYITDFKWGQTFTTTYVDRGVFEELFIAPKALNESSGEVSLYVRTVPFITFIWGGLFLMIAGIISLVLVDRSLENSSPKAERPLNGKQNNGSKVRKGAKK